MVILHKSLSCDRLHVMGLRLRVLAFKQICSETSRDTHIQSGAKNVAQGL